MGNPIDSDLRLTAYARNLARGIVREFTDAGTALADIPPHEFYERADEVVDSDEHTIYTAKAWRIAANCDLSRAEETMRICGGFEADSLDDLVVRAVFFELRDRAEQAFNDWQDDPDSF